MSPTNRPIISTRQLVRGGIMAALYLSLTMLTQPIAFGPMQFRVSEALTVLPILLPEAIPGLFIGCFLSNLLGGAPWQDVVFGSLATLAAGFLTYLLRKRPLVAAIPPVAINAVVIALVICWTSQTASILLPAMGGVALGQTGACYLLGMPLLLVLRRLPDSLWRR